jgi:hypothetical protein
VSSDEDWIDPDIRAKDLEYGEKAGLQIYRNYTRQFEAAAIERFVAVIDQERLNLEDFSHLTTKIAAEDGRYLPVIICAFADDLLKAVFKRALPDDIPGGKAGMLSGYGPLSDLSKRIQLAHAFRVLSPDLMETINKVRLVRNKLAHSWDITDLDQFFGEAHLGAISPIEELIWERPNNAQFKRDFDALTKFRVRMVWVVGRLVYEAAGYHRARFAGVDPYKALYQSKTKWLTEVAAKAMSATAMIFVQAGMPVPTDQGVVDDASLKDDPARG